MRVPWALAWGVRDPRHDTASLLNPGAGHPSPLSGLQLSHLSREGDKIAKVQGTILSSLSCYYGTGGSAWEEAPVGVGMELAGVACLALTLSVFVPQEYLLGEGSLSQAATQLLGDVMSEDGFFYLSFAEALRAHSCLSDRLR